MKNIHVLPTKGTGAVYISKDVTPNLYSNWRGEGHHIYITSKEYIGLSYYLDGNLVRKGVIDDKDYWEVRKDYEKIILTTDPKLIEDGVQGIDNVFVTWFINNPTCEFVKIDEYNTFGVDNWKYLITIPEDIVKEQTIEEIVETLDTKQLDELDIFLKGVQWKEEQDKNKYSEEEVLDIAQQLRLKLKLGVLKWRDDFDFDLEEWFEQFKKK